MNLLKEFHSHLWLSSQDPLEIVHYPFPVLEFHQYLHGLFTSDSRFSFVSHFAHLLPSIQGEVELSKGSIQSGDKCCPLFEFAGSEVIFEITEEGSAVDSGIVAEKILEVFEGYTFNIPLDQGVVDHLQDLFESCILQLYSTLRVLGGLIVQLFLQMLLGRFSNKLLSFELQQLFQKEFSTFLSLLGLSFAFVLFQLSLLEILGNEQRHRFLRFHALLIANTQVLRIQSDQLPNIEVDLLHNILSLLKLKFLYQGPDGIQLDLIYHWSVLPNVLS